jgi:hypothetical protein
MTSGGAVMLPSGEIVTPVPPSPVDPELEDAPLEPPDDPPDPLELPPEPLLLPPPLLDPPPLLLLCPPELPDEDEPSPRGMPPGEVPPPEHPSATARHDSRAIFDSFMTNSRLLVGARQRTRGRQNEASAHGSPWRTY